MDKETAIRIISKPAPCKHPSYRIFYERNDGYPSCQCDTCGRIYRHGMHPDIEKYEKEYIKEFNEALEYLRSLPEPSSPVDDEYEQAFAEYKAYLDARNLIKYGFTAGGLLDSNIPYFINEMNELFEIFDTVLHYDAKHGYVYDEEFEQVYSAWRDESDSFKYCNRVEISPTGYRVYRNGNIALSITF